MMILCPYDGKECWSSGCFFQHGQNKICTKQSSTFATTGTTESEINSLKEQLRKERELNEQLKIGLEYCQRLIQTMKYEL